MKVTVHMVDNTWRHLDVPGEFAMSDVNAALNEAGTDGWMMMKDASGATYVFNTRNVRFFQFGD